MLIHKNFGKSFGFTLIEILMLIAILSVVATVTVSTVVNTVQQDRMSTTVGTLQEIRRSMVGDVTAMSGGARSSFGYLGDVGGLPNGAQGISALISNPGVPSGGWALNAQARIGIGWNGPYVSAGSSGASYTKDGWGNNLVYNASIDTATITSYGADGVPGGTGLNADITIQMPRTTLFSTVYGVIQNSGAQWSGTAQVELNMPNGQGVLTQVLTNIVPVDKGLFSFSNVPMGVRSATAYFPSKSAPTKTIGPMIFVADRVKSVIPTKLLDFTLGGGGIEVPIEMADFPLGAISEGSNVFNRTRTSLDTTDYDGQVSYFFEIVASNTDATKHTVSVVDSGGVSRSTIEIPASTSAVTRLRVGFTPNSGADNYRVMLAAAPNNKVTVYTARILVNQTAQTKTNLYIPLISGGKGKGGGDDGDHGDGEGDGDGDDSSDSHEVDGTNSVTFTQNAPESYVLWNKNTSAYSTIAAGSPWVLEVVLSSKQADGTAYASLFNATTGNQITGASVSATGTQPSLSRVAFANSAVNFTDTNNMELRIKSDSKNSKAKIYKAGLWLKLTSLLHAEVRYRAGIRYSGGTSVTLNTARVFLNTALFSAPNVFFETTGWRTGAAGSSTVSLWDGGIVDNGTAGAKVNNSSLVLPLSRERMSTFSTALNITSGNRFLIRIECPQGAVRVASSFLVVQF